MRKSFSILLAVCFALSCAKQNPQCGDDASGGTLPQGERIDHITALGPGAPVRTVVSEGTKVLWTDADKIGLYAPGPATAIYTTVLDEPKAEATFGRTSENNPVKVGDRYYAVYPSSSIVKWGAQTDIEEQTGAFCTVNIPKQQNAAVGSWDTKAAILAASSETAVFSFNHAVAYLRFEVTDQTGSFVSVRLTSNNNEKLSDPQARLQYLPSGELQVTPGATANDYVNLRNSTADADFEAGVYNIAILPGDFTGGLTLSFTDAEGHVAQTSVASVSLNPGEVADCGQIARLNFGEALAPLELASVYKEDGVNQGVVFWIDPENPYKGKIVSASSASAMDWSENFYSGYLWTTKIESQEDGLLNYVQFNASDDYTSQKEKFYAMNYCEELRESLGGEWYLPAPMELRILCQAYYGLSETPPSTNGETEYRFENGELIQGVMATKAEYDAALRLLGETATATLDGDADGDGICDDNGHGDAGGVTYWSSKVNTGGPVQYVNIGVYYLNNTGKLARQGYVRCVRNVDINGADVDPEPEPEPEDPAPDQPALDEMETGIDPLNPFDIYNMPKRVSLVGDSITTFEGTLVTEFDAENGGAYYPVYVDGVPTKVTSVTEQYWYKLIHGKMGNAMLEVNNSLRGSMVTRRTQENYLNVDFSARTAIYGLGSPDVVFIHGGTNDCTKHSESYQYRPGMYRADMLLSDDFLQNSFDAGFVDNEAYTNEPYKGMAPANLPTDAEFNAVYTAAEAADTWEEILALEDRSFIHSYVKLLNMIHFKHPHAKVVMIIGDAVTKRCMQAIIEIAEHYDQKYGYKYVNFSNQGLENQNISKASGVHPDGNGFTYMANTIYDQVGTYIDPKN